MKTHEIIEQLKANNDRELARVEQQLIYNRVREWTIAGKDEADPMDDKFMEAFSQMVLDKVRHYYRLMSQEEYDRRFPKDLSDALLNSKVDVVFWDFINRYNNDKYFLNKVHDKRDTRSCLWTLLFFILLLLGVYLYFSHKMNKQVDAVEKQATTMLLTPAEGCDNGVITV